MRCGLTWVVLLCGLTSVLLYRADKTTRKENSEVWTSGNEANQKNSKNIAVLSRKLHLAHQKLIVRTSNRPLTTIRPKGTRRRIFYTKGLTLDTIKDVEHNNRHRKTANDKQKTFEKEQSLNNKRLEAGIPELIEQSGEALSGEGSGSGDFTIDTRHPVFSRYEKVIYHKSQHIHFHQNGDKQTKSPVPIDLAFQPHTEKSSGNPAQTQTQAAAHPPTQSSTQPPTQPATQPPTQPLTYSPTQPATQPATHPPTKTATSEIFKLRKKTTSYPSITPKATAKITHTPSHPTNYLPNPQTWIPAVSSYPTPLQSCQSDIDLVILTEASRSIGHTGFDNYKLVINFIKDIVHRLVISSKYIRVGLITFDLKPYIHLGLYGGSKLKNILRAIDRPSPVRQSGWKVRSGAALDFTYKSFFGCYCDRKSTRKKMVLVVTDGRSIDDVFWPATRIKDAGIQILSVGIGRYFDVHQLNSMASRPSSRNVFTSSFSKLHYVVDTIVKRICEVSHGALVTTKSCPCR